MKIKNVSKKDISHVIIIIIKTKIVSSLDIQNFI